MNCWNVKTRQIGTQFVAIVRRVDRAEAYRLSDKGRPILYPTETAAEIAGLRHIVHLLNTEIRFEVAPKAPPAVALEEKTFGTVTSRKGKKTRVERQRRRQAKKRAA